MALWDVERGVAEARMDQELLERVMAMTVAEGTLAGRMGIKITSASASRVVGTMPVDGNTQPFGLLHGGASCVLAETIGSLGAALHAGPGRVVVGIEISATHHRGAREGEVTAVATLVHGGQTLATYDIVVTDSAGRRVCTSRLTCLIRGHVPGHDGNGIAPSG
jgi:1,4-dihydroxy-2-naphthoyl-CoA hydrolase